MLLAVDDSLKRNFEDEELRVFIGLIAALNPRADGAVKGVIFRAKYVAPAVPSQHGFAGGVIEHPTVASIHAVLKEQIPGNVVTGRKASRWVGLIRRHRRRDVLHHQVLAGIT